MLLLLSIFGLFFYSALFIGIIALHVQKRHHVPVPTRHVILPSILSTLIMAVLIIADRDLSSDDSLYAITPLIIGAIYMLIYIGIFKINQHPKLKPWIQKINKPIKLKQRSKKLKLKCPHCGRSLKGATQSMIGDTGVCPKCNTEFTIGSEN